jgi:hypothetical protein
VRCPICNVFVEVKVLALANISADGRIVEVQGKTCGHTWQQHIDELGYGGSSVEPPDDCCDAGECCQDER